MKSAVAVTLVMMSLVANARASSCFVVAPEFPWAYEHARAVFTGEVVKIEKPLSSDPAAPLASRFHRVTFKVDYSWKGAGFREVGLTELVLLSDQGHHHCYSWNGFSEGRKYLVFATESTDKNLIVMAGTRTGPLENATEDLAKLKKLDALILFPARNDSAKLNWWKTPFN